MEVWDEKPRTEKQKKTAHLRLSESDLDLFKQAVRDSDLIGRSKVDYWITEIDRGNEDPIIALLLTVLPNLTEIDFEGCPYPISCVFEVLGSIPYQKVPVSLRNLRTVTVRHCDYDGHEDIDLIRSFSVVPSLKHLTGHMIGSEPNGLLQGTALYLNCESNITNLTLAWSAVCKKPQSNVVCHSLS